MTMLVLSSFYLLRNYCVIANPILISNPGIIIKVLFATVLGLSLKHSEPSYYSTMLIYFLASLLSGSLLTLFKCAFHFLPFHLFTLNPSSIFITTVDLVSGKRLRRKLQQGVCNNQPKQKDKLQ